MSRLTQHIFLKAPAIFVVLAALLPAQAVAQTPELPAPSGTAPVAQAAAEASGPDLQQLAQQAAVANKLPVDYFMRLIR